MKAGRQKGFTLIELVIVVVIVGILAAIAMPSYLAYVLRGNRGAAESQMMDIANREQQFMLANRVYADKPTLEGNGYALPTNVGNKYTYGVAVGGGAGAPPTFTITFTPTGSQATDGVLVLTSDGVKTRNGDPAQW